MPGKKLLLLIVVFGLARTKSVAQNLSADTTRYAADAQQAIDNFNTAIDGQSEIYNGTQYYLYPAANRRSAYFNNAVYCVPGAMRYNGTVYKNVPLLYDMSADVMISAEKDILYVLQQDKVSDVFLAGHHFINMKAGANENLAPGFYDELYDGKSQVLVKRVRQINSITSAQSIETIYENKDIIYIKKGNNYYPVRSKGSVMSFFGNKKKQLRRYLTAEGIRYKDDSEGAIVKLATYYDQINN